MRFRVRRNVDLPQPEGPISAVICFSGTSRLMSCSAWKVAVEKVEIRGLQLRPCDGCRPVTPRGRQMVERVISLIFADSGMAAHTYKLTPFEPRCSARQHPAGGDIRGQHQHEQHQAGGPGLPVPVLVRRNRVRVNHDRQRSGGLLQLVRPELVVEAGEQQRRGFAGDARHAQDHAGKDALFGRRHHHRAEWSGSCSRPARAILRAANWARRAETVRCCAGRWESSSGSARSRRPTPRNGACGTTTMVQAKMPITMDGTPFSRSAV